MTAAMGVLGWDSTAADHDEGIEDDEKSRHARERRSKGLERFILALSDQQLVTGLAVLIAGFVSTCSMSIYHFNNSSARMVLFNNSPVYTCSSSGVFH